MATTVETRPVNETDTDIMRVRVRTQDAIGNEREYSIGIDPKTVVDGEHVMSGRRIDDDAPDEAAGGGPSNRAYDAAAKRFNAAGYEVFGR